MLDLRHRDDDDQVFGEFVFWHNGKRTSSGEMRIGVLTESESDSKLFRSLFAKDQVKCHALVGKQKVLRILARIRNAEIPDVIAIVDADFDRLERRLPAQGDGVFLTDHHDAEMMMAHSKAWDKLLNEHADFSKDHEGKLKQFEEKTSSSILNVLLNALKPLSCARLLNERQNLDMKFKSETGAKASYVDFPRFINSKTLSCNFSEMLKSVENKSVQIGFFQRNPEHLEAVKALCQEDHHLPDLCNGHELLEVLSIALEEAIGNKKSSNKVSGHQLGEDLRKAYHFSDFQQTELYKALRAWESSREGLPLFKPS